MDLLTAYECARIQIAIEESIATLGTAGISLRVRRNFETYAAIRRIHGDIHLNQAFDPRETGFGHDDFWLLAENHDGEAIATYCLRRFFVEDFYALIRSQALWFSSRSPLVDPHFQSNARFRHSVARFPMEAGCGCERIIADARDWRLSCRVSLGPLPYACDRSITTAV
jgi:hypothetical protein